MGYMQDIKFLNICKVYVTVDSVIKMPEEMKNRMKLLIMYRKNYESFNLYYEKLKPFLISMANLHKVKCPEMSKWIGHL